MIQERKVNIGCYGHDNKNFRRSYSQVLPKYSGNYSKFQWKKPKPQSFFNRVGDFQSPDFFKRNSSSIVFPQILPKFSEQFSYIPSPNDCFRDSLERKDTVSYLLPLV